jgi:hypothetical protein
MPQHMVLQNRVREMPPELHTAAYRLFHYYRRVQVQQLFTMNAKTLAQVGSPTSGNPAQDSALRTQWVTVSLTAVEMVAYKEKGAALLFEDTKTPTQLYLDLVDHLRGWLDIFNKNPNLRRAPLEDLRKFDELAAAVFPYASAQLMPNAFLAKQARRRRGLAAELFAIKEEQAPVRQFYRPLSDQIAERLARRLGH